MIRELQGDLHGNGLRIGVVVSRFNWFVTSKLLDGAKEALAEHAVRDEDITVVTVPGSFEIPLVARRMAESNRYDAVICLGAVIRGGTDHYAYVAGEATRGIADVSRLAGVPVIFGVLTTDTGQQALDRAGGEEGNKGYDASVAALEMANLLRKLGAG